MRWTPQRGAGDLIRRPMGVDFNAPRNLLMIRALEEDNPFIWQGQEAQQRWAERATEAAMHDEREARIYQWQRQQDTPIEPHDARMRPTIDPYMRAQLLLLQARAAKPLPPKPRSMMLPYPGEYWPSGPVPKEKPMPKIPKKLPRR